MLKGVIALTNLDRVKIEIKGINFTDDEINIYLFENDLEPTKEYEPTSKNNKRNILSTALNILESIANNVELMRNYKTEDISVTQFSENLEKRIDSLSRKIRQIPNDNEGYSDGATFVYMFDR